MVMQAYPTGDALDACPGEFCLAPKTDHPTHKTQDQYHEIPFRNGVYGPRCRLHRNNRHQPAKRPIMKSNFNKLVLGAGLVLLGATAQAQGLQGVAVEQYATVSAADAAYYNGLGSGTYQLTAGMKVYRIYIDMAPGYKLNSVFGSAANVLDITSTTPFFNDDAFGGQYPPQTSRFDEGGAYDSWITIARAGRSGGSAASCGGNLEQMGVLRTADTNGNLTLCNLWTDFGAASNDGHVPGTSIDPSTVGITGASLLAVTANGNVFSTTGSYSLLPPQNGPELNGANRVLIGQFTTAGTFSFHINVALNNTVGGVEFYTHSTQENGATVSPFLTYPQIAFVGCSTNQTPYLTAIAPGITNQSLLTVGDIVGGFKMVGIPDGLGAFDNGNGTFTLLMNHELASTDGIVRTHGSAGAFVSKFIINKSTLCVQSGSDLIQTVQLWNGTAFAPSTAVFTRFCGAELASGSAFYNPATGKGTLERLFLNGEESGNEGRAFGHIATGPNAGTTYQLPYLGRFSWENAIASPVMSDKTVVAGTDDATPGQVYI